MMRRIVGGAAVIGAAALVVAPTPVPAPQAMAVGTIRLLADADIVIDFIRHGESTDNVAGILGTRLPGALLTDLGRQQANDLGNALGYHSALTSPDQVWASEFLRAQQTAWPLLQILHQHTAAAETLLDPIPTPETTTTLADTVSSAFTGGHILSGLNELDAGLLQGLPLGAPGAILYMLPAMAWTLGLYAVPQWGSTIDPNGMAFQDSFSEAVQTIYAGTADGQTAAAFSHAASIMAWTQMNVDNPNPLLIALSPLDNVGQVVIEGNPVDGWTMTEWNGLPIAPANLWQDLFVATRNLIVAPQMAAWHLGEALTGGDVAAILPALQQGLTEIAETTLHYPGVLLGDIVGALSGDIVAELDPTTLIPVDLAGLLTGLLTAL